MKIHIIPSEKFTTNILCVLIRRPLCRDDVTENAIIPALLSRGCEKYPSVRDIRLAAESMQGSIFDAQIVKKGEYQLLQFFLEFVNDDSKLEESGIEFLHEVINRPKANDKGFHTPFVRSESENLKNRIAGRINNKSDFAKLKCLETMCRNEPFGLYGDGYAEDLSSITPHGLHNKYKDILSNSPIDFIALGKWDENWLTDKLKEKFGNFVTPPDFSPIAPELRQARAERQIIKLDYGSSQGNLCIGLRGMIPQKGMDFIHLQLANEILGGGPNAKLFANVREKESLCYAIFSMIFRFKSLMCIMAGTEPDKMEHVFNLAEQEIEALKCGHFTEGDLSSAKHSLAKRWRAMQDNPSACVDFYASQYLLNDTQSIDGLLLKIDEATTEGVTNAAKSLDIDTVVMVR